MKKSNVFILLISIFIIKILINLTTIDTFLYYTILILITIIINKFYLKSPYKPYKIKNFYNDLIKFIILLTLAAIIIILRLVSLKILYPSNLYNLVIPINWISSLILMTFMIFSEELYFRYLTFNMIKSKYIIFISSIIFAFYHVDLYVIYMKYNDIPLFVNNFISWILMGIILSYSYSLTNNILYSVILHIGINFISPFIILNENFSQGIIINFINNNAYLIIILLLLFLLRNKLNKKTKLKPD